MRRGRRDDPGRRPAHAQSAAQPQPQQPRPRPQPRSRHARVPEPESLDDPTHFNVLFVCTGNIHRSAMAERLMIGRVDLSLPVTIASAGVSAVVGHPMAANSMTASAELGADPSEHIARQLVPPLADRADLILTAERAHRERILEDSPRAMRRTFTLRRFCWLAAPLGPPDYDRPTTEQLRERVRLVAAQPRTPAKPDEDIADPVRASVDETRLRAREIADCVDIVVAALGLGRRGLP